MSSGPRGVVSRNRPQSARGLCPYRGNDPLHDRQHGSAAVSRRGYGKRAAAAPALTITDGAGRVYDHVADAIEAKRRVSPTNHSGHGPAMIAAATAMEEDEVRVALRVLVTT